MKKVTQKFRRALLTNMHEDGQDLVEYALVLPLLLLVMLGIMEFGILFWNYNTIANAAREGARAGIIPGVTVEQIEARVLDSAVGLNPTLLQTPQITLTNSTVEVRVVYSTTLITAPMIGAVGGDGAITLNAVATMNRE